MAYSLLFLSVLYVLLSILWHAQGNTDDPYLDFQDRVDQYLLATARQDNCNFNNQLAILVLQEDSLFCPDAIFNQIDKINQHKDGTDFSLHGFGWILHHFWDNPLITQEMKYGIVEAVTNIPLYLSYPGWLGSMQYQSENHLIGWNAAEYIIGSAFANNPDLASLVFPSSGQTGQYHAQVGKERVMRWLNFRIKYGFSEFNSDTYGKIALRAVIALVGCAPDTEVRDLANIVMNLQLYDHILGSLGIKLATARGRAYTEGKLTKTAYGLMYTVKGAGQEQDQGLGASESVYFTLGVALGRYQMPRALLQVGTMVEEEDLILDERFGFDDSEHEIDEETVENCISWLSNGGYFSPEHPRCLFIVGDGYDLWDRTDDTWGTLKIAKPIWDYNPELIDTVGEIGAPLGHGAILGPANMRTFRSRGLMLSSVQDYKGGFMAGQQHAWQATLDYDRKGTVFSLQPLAPNGTDGHDDMYWVGGILPKIGQFGSSLISIYSPEVLNTAVFGLRITHAHFNHKEYDEFLQYDNGDNSTWLIGRQDDLFVGLYSWTGGQFVAESNGEERDFVSQGVQNVYICEVGSLALNGSFEAFKDNIISSNVQVDVFYNDTLLGCLLEHHCLNGIQHLIDCLLDECSFSLDEADLKTIEDSVAARETLSIYQAVAKRINQIRQSVVDVVYTRGETVFQYSLDRPLTVDGNEVKTSDFMRYDNRFSRMNWADRNISIEAGEYGLFMDFDTQEIIEL